MREKKELRFTDYVEIITDTYDSTLYSPVFSNTLGLYLFNEEERPIRDILLFNYKIMITYIDGRIRVLDNEVLSVNISDNFFKRRMHMTIAGNLFKYDKESAMYYGLDVTKAVNYEKNKFYPIRKRSL